MRHETVGRLQTGLFGAIEQKNYVAFGRRGFARQLPQNLQHRCHHYAVVATAYNLKRKMF